MSLSNLALQITAGGLVGYTLGGLAVVAGFWLGLTPALRARFRPSAWLAVALAWPLFVIRGAVALADAWRLGR